MCVGLSDLETNVISLLWWILVDELRWNYVTYPENLVYSFRDGFEFN